MNPNGMDRPTADDAGHAPASSAVWPFEHTAVACYLIFLFFFMFQLMCGIFAYHPFQVTGNVHYAYRTLLAGGLFLGPLLFFTPAGWPRRVVAAGWLAFLVITLCYVGGVVSARPALDNASDRNEALSITIRSTLAGEFPYGKLTPLGNPITPLTASLLIALPTELAFGRPELMSLPMLAIAVACLAWLHARTRARVPLLVILTLLLLNPALIWELSWGGDLLWGNVLLLGATLATLAGRPVTAGALLGAAICTRLGFGVLLPLWGMYWLRTHGRAAWRPLLAVAAVGLVLELPYLLWDPHTFIGFSPVRTSVEKVAYGFPPGDNALSDLLNHALPTWLGRMLLSGVGLGLLAAALGWRARTPRELSLAMAVLFAAALLLMGQQMDLAYLNWVILPAVTALALGDAGSPVPGSRSSLARVAASQIRPAVEDESVAP